MIHGIRMWITAWKIWMQNKKQISKNIFFIYYFIMPEKAVIPSLVGTVSPLISTDVSKLETLARTSPFIPRNWLKCTPFLLDEQILTSQNPSTLNGEMTYELPKLATMLYDMVLQIKTPPVTTQGPSLQPSFYVDMPALAIIDFFNIIFGANQVFNVQSYDLYFRYRNWLTRERLEQINEISYGDSTTAERTSLLTNGTEANPMMMPLWLPFSNDSTCSLPIVTLSQKTRFILKTDSLDNITQKSPLNTLVPIGNYEFTLLITVVYTTGDESNYLLQLAQDNMGVSYMVHQSVRQNVDDFATRQTGAIFTARLAGMTKPLQILYFGFIPLKLINNTGRNDKFFFRPNPPAPVPPGMSPYNPIVSYREESNGLIIQRDVLRNYIRLYKHQFYFPSPGGDEVFFQTFSLQPMATNAALGYLDYTNLNNPTLYVTFGAGGTGPDPDNPAIPQVVRLIVNAMDYNFWFFKSGNLARAFN